MTGGAPRVSQLGDLHLVLPRGVDPAEGQGLAERRVEPGRPWSRPLPALREPFDVGQPLATVADRGQPLEEGVRVRHGVSLASADGLSSGVTDP